MKEIGVETDGGESDGDERDGDSIAGMDSRSGGDSMEGCGIGVLGPGLEGFCRSIYCRFQQTLSKILSLEPPLVSSSLIVRLRHLLNRTSWL